MFTKNDRSKGLTPYERPYNLQMGFHGVKFHPTYRGESNNSSFSKGPTLVLHHGWGFSREAPKSGNCKECCCKMFTRW